jgi:hypothetical protein
MCQVPYHLGHELVHELYQNLGHVLMRDLPGFQHCALV